MSAIRLYFESIKFTYELNFGAGPDFYRSEYLPYIIGFLLDEDLDEKEILSPLDSRGLGNFVSFTYQGEKYTIHEYDLQEMYPCDFTEHGFSFRYEDSYKMRYNSTVEVKESLINSSDTKGNDGVKETQLFAPPPGSYSVHNENGNRVLFGSLNHPNYFENEVTSSNKASSSQLNSMLIDKKGESADTNTEIQALSMSLGSLSPSGQLPLTSSTLMEDLPKWNEFCLQQIEKFKNFHVKARKDWYEFKEKEKYLWIINCNDPRVHCIPYNQPNETVEKKLDFAFGRAFSMIEYICLFQSGEDGIFRASETILAEIVKPMVSANTTAVPLASISKMVIPTYLRFRLSLLPGNQQFSFLIAYLIFESTYTNCSVGTLKMFNLSLDVQPDLLRHLDAMVYPNKNGFSNNGQSVVNPLLLHCLKRLE